jgi:uncharacterized repeat protein (TIGR03803 family)
MGELSWKSSSEKPPTEGTLTTLYSFCVLSGWADGSAPLGGLIQARDGNFYGTTCCGGSDGVSGTVFRITPNGKLTTLHSFDGFDGELPFAGLVEATDGNFHRTTTYFIGSKTLATVFKVSFKDKFIPLHKFNGADVALPYAGLIQATNGNFYGTT